eukprot:1161186-Pelagomonas_calceolata.AAC.2
MPPIQLSPPPPPAQPLRSPAAAAACGAAGAALHALRAAAGLYGRRTQRSASPHPAPHTLPARAAPRQWQTPTARCLCASWGRPMAGRACRLAQWLLLRQLLLPGVALPDWALAVLQVAALVQHLGFAPQPGAHLALPRAQLRWHLCGLAAAEHLSGLKPATEGTKCGK